MVPASELDPRLLPLLEDLRAVQARKRQGLITPESALSFFRLMSFLHKRVQAGYAADGLYAVMHADTSGREYFEPYGAVYSGPQTRLWFSDGQFGVEREHGELEMWGDFKTEGLTIWLTFEFENSQSRSARYRDVLPVYMLQSKHLLALGFERFPGDDRLKFEYSNSILQCKKMFKRIDS